MRRLEIEGYDPFWAVTRYADVARVSRQPRSFLNAPRLVFSSQRFPQRRAEEIVRSLLNMDPPEHGKYRGVVNRRFTPHALSFLRSHVEALSRQDRRRRRGARDRSRSSTAASAISSRTSPPACRSPSSSSCSAWRARTGRSSSSGRTGRSRRASRNIAVERRRSRPRTELGSRCSTISSGTWLCAVASRATIW